MLITSGGKVGGQPVVCRFVRKVISHAAGPFLRIWHCIRYLPPRETRELLSQTFTLYGFFIGAALAIAAIILIFDFVKVYEQPKFVEDSTSQIKVELEWNPNYVPQEEIEQALQALLTGKVYQQPVEIMEYDEFRFPQSDYDLLSVPRRPVPAGALLFLKWRIGTVPPLPSNKDPMEALLPVMGDTWEWNIDPKLLKYISDSSPEIGERVAWYKIAIAMVGGYSKQFTQGLSIDERIAAINAFSKATWTYEVKYRVWNSGRTQAKSCRIVPGVEDVNIVPPENIDWNEFFIQPGAANRLEFTLYPVGQFNSLGSAESNAAELRKNIKTLSPPLEKIRGSPWLWVGVPLLGGFVLATLVKRFYKCR